MKKIISVICIACLSTAAMASDQDAPKVDPDKIEAQTKVANEAEKADKNVDEKTENVEQEAAAKDEKTTETSPKKPIQVDKYSKKLGVVSDKVVDRTDIDSGSLSGLIYNKDTKSYFEVRAYRGTWNKAYALAKTREYKGTAGRLAHVKSLNTHQFIIRNFKLSGPTWIGLQYFCRNQKVKWVDASNELGNLPFTAWAPKWARTDVRCGGKNYMPVYYTGSNSSTPFRWQASGPAKGFHYYLVEYPTGRE